MITISEKLDLVKEYFSYNNRQAMNYINNCDDDFNYTLIKKWLNQEKEK